MGDFLDTQEILDRIKTAYGSLEQPDYSFMRKRYDALLRHKFVADVMARFFVKNDTDLNDHAALHLRIRHDDGVVVQACLSFVSNYAILFRFREDSLVYSDVIVRSTPGLRGFEIEVLDLLQGHQLRLLSKYDAATSIDMNLFVTEKCDVRIYHALIADCGIVPRVLL